MNPRLEILPSPRRVYMWSPGDRKGIHAELIFQQVRGVDTVFPTRARHYAIMPTVIPAVVVAYRYELSFPFLPIDRIVLQVMDLTGVANAVFTNRNRNFLGLQLMPIFNRRCWSLIGQHT